MASRRRVVWSHQARHSLEEILDFIQQDSREGARQVLEQALAAASSLSTLSERGRVVPELAEPSIREVFVYRYRLMYRVTEASVEILAFIHGARDFERLRSGE